MRQLVAVTALIAGLVGSACSTSTVPYPTVQSQPQASDVVARCIALGRVDGSSKELAGAKPLPSDAPLRAVIAEDEMAGGYPVYLYDALCANRQGFAPYKWLMDALPPSYDTAQVGYVAAVYPPSGKPPTWDRIRALHFPGLDASTLTKSMPTVHLLWCVVQAAAYPGQQAPCNEDVNPSVTPIDPVSDGLERLDCNGGDAGSACADFAQAVGYFGPIYVLPSHNTVFIMQSTDESLAREFAQLAHARG